MKRIIMLLVIALIMTLLVALSASAVFAEPTTPPAATCGLEKAEAHAPPQADAHIPKNPAFACLA